MTEEALPGVLALLERCRERERAQTRYYRGLAAEAELEERPDLTERLNELHADEQHHLSRLTARILELGGQPQELAGGSGPEASLAVWENTARRREADEVEWYETLLGESLDAETRALFEEILASERRHKDVLGGKWMPA